MPLYSSSTLGENVRARWLDWSAKQGRILTGGEKVLDFFSAENGFPFDQSELPHFHLGCKDTHETFARWRREDLSGPYVGAWLTGACACLEIQTH